VVDYHVLAYCGFYPPMQCLNHQYDNNRLAETEVVQQKLVERQVPGTVVTLFFFGFVFVAFFCFT
jgi:hypothetical protein